MQGRPPPQPGSRAARLVLTQLQFLTEAPAFEKRVPPRRRSHSWVLRSQGLDKQQQKQQRLVSRDPDRNGSLSDPERGQEGGTGSSLEEKLELISRQRQAFLRSRERFLSSREDSGRVQRQVVEDTFHPLVRKGTSPDGAWRHL